MDTAPRDGTLIYGLYSSDESDACLILWAERRQCMLAGVGGGNGYFGPGWEDDLNHLIVDDPIAWKSEEEFATGKRIKDLECELQFWLGPKHEGDCAYTDKTDEGCYLCRDAEKARYPKSKQLLKGSK